MRPPLPAPHLAHLARLACLLVCLPLVGCAGGLIGDSADDDAYGTNVPDSGLRPNSDSPDAGPSMAAPRAVLLAPAPNIGYRSIAVIDAENGADLGVLIDYANYPELSTGSPIHAAQDPMGRIFVLDSSRKIHIFSKDAVLLSTNLLADIVSPEAPKSLDFYGDEMWVSTNKGRVLRYSGTGKPLAPKLSLATPANLEDLLILGNGSFLIANASDDKIQLYDADGIKIRDLLNIDFPQQLQQTDDGDFMVSAYSEDAVVLFDINGNEQLRLQGANIDGPRGIAPMKNGNYAVSVYFFDLGCDGGGCLIQQLNAAAELSLKMQDGPAVRRLERAYLTEETVANLAN